MSDGIRKKIKIMKPILAQSYLAANKNEGDYLPTIPIAEPNVTKTSFLSTTLHDKIVDTASNPSTAFKKDLKR